MNGCCSLLVFIPLIIWYPSVPLLTPRQGARYIHGQRFAQIGCCAVLDWQERVRDGSANVACDSSLCWRQSGGWKQQLVRCDRLALEPRRTLPCFLCVGMHSRVVGLGYGVTGVRCTAAQPRVVHGLPVVPAHESIGCRVCEPHCVCVDRRRYVTAMRPPLFSSEFDASPRICMAAPFSLTFHLRRVLRSCASGLFFSRQTALVQVNDLAPLLCFATTPVLPPLITRLQSWRSYFFAAQRRRALRCGIPAGYALTCSPSCAAQ